MSVKNLTGQTLGQYELRELLGSGGMGAVYRGFQTNLKRYVAVKIMSSDLAQQPGYLERFAREAETSAALSHPNIIKIFDYGTQQGNSFLVMDLLTGGTLSERIHQAARTDNPLPSLGEVAHLLVQLGSALDYAHSQGVIHRDIKPSNVMFDNHGNAYLVDFGIAKLAQATQGLTATGQVIGTWGYMAPEQWRNEELSAATDQYALGVMAYALVTGRMPFESATPAGIMHRHLTEMPTPPHTARPDVPEAVTFVIERALAKHPSNRFPTCTAFAQAFDGAIRGNTGTRTMFFTMPVQSRRSPRTPSAAFTPSGGQAAGSGAVTAARPVHRHPLVWGMAAVMAILIGVVIMLMAGGGDDDSGSAAAGNAAASATAAASESPTATPTTVPAVVIMVTDTDTPTPTDTPTHTYTPIPTSTPDLQATLQAEILLLQTETVETAQALLTLTATHWTATATPDLKATAAEMLAQTQAAQQALDQTATATMWTDTPAPTATLTATATATLTATLTPTPTLTDTASPTATVPPTNTATPSLVPGPSRVPPDAPQIRFVQVLDSSCPGAEVELEFANIEGQGAFYFDTIAESGGLIYMDEYFNSSSKSDGLHDWGIYDDDDRGRQEASFADIEPGAAVNVTITLRDGENEAVLSQDEFSFVCGGERVEETATLSPTPTLATGGDPEWRFVEVLSTDSCGTGSSAARVQIEFIDVEGQGAFYYETVAESGGLIYMDEYFDSTTKTDGEESWGIYDKDDRGRQDASFEDIEAGAVVNVTITLRDGESEAVLSQDEFSFVCGGDAVEVPPTPAPTVAAGGPEWRFVEVLRTDSCGTGSSSAARVQVEFIDVEGQGKFYYETVAESGGLIYMDEYFDSATKTDGTDDWGIYDHDDRGRREASFEDIEAGAVVNVTITLRDGESEAVLSRDTFSFVCGGDAVEVPPTPAPTVAAGGPEWRFVEVLRTDSCGTGSSSAARVQVEFIDVEGQGKFYYETVAESGGLVYMDEYFDSATKTDGTDDWGIYDHDDRGRQEASFADIEAGAVVNVTLTLRDGESEAVLSQDEFSFICGGDEGQEPAAASASVPASDPDMARARYASSAPANRLSS